ncbi:laminin subunit gamma-2 [Oryzias melastigma]|nr:laminin subunit gamma-2 [Oryzias melastigma]
MKRRGGLVLLCALAAALCVAHAHGHSRHHSQYCQWDGWGLRCKQCKDGFYLQRPGLICTPCNCHPTGAISATCDSRGRCSCKDGVSGEKCDRCSNGIMGPNGCSPRRQPREDSGNLPCFCYGHSSRCFSQSGFSVHNISSTFTSGSEGWRVTTAKGDTPRDVLFRWSPKYQDLEVISKESLPIYLSAPDSYLGNQLLSYTQNFSFGLRLDRGVRRPSAADVILEGAGLRVSASLGDLSSIVPCGQKIGYSFRLDQQPGSGWRPPLSPFEFQKLLQNLTAIRIRTTFGEAGRGYLDNVNLVSARRGSGVPAQWVQTCICPPGHEGDSCERCSAGFRRSIPADGAFSPCKPGDPENPDRFSADETPTVQRCQSGFYKEPRQGGACVRCPCAEGESCSLPPGFVEPRCDRCPTGTSGPGCDTCLEGFYGDPAGSTGQLRPCKPCNCDAQGSESVQCDTFGRCRCKPGFEGPTCRRASCPACFSPVQRKVEENAAKVKELERLLPDQDSGPRPGDSSKMEAALKVTEELLNYLQETTEELKEIEKGLQGRLSSVRRTQLTERQDIQDIAREVDSIVKQRQTYETKVKEVQALLEVMEQKMEEGKAKIRSVEVPVSDAPLSPNNLTSLVPKASSLADQHQKKANAVERTANEALSDSEKSLALLRTLTNRENKVKELIGDLKALNEQNLSEVKILEKEASRLSDEATEESKMADDMLKDIAIMEGKIPGSGTEQIDAMAARLDETKEAVNKNISDLEDLQTVVQQEQAAARDLLDEGRAGLQEFNRLLDRVNGAKAVTEEALKRITINNNKLDDALSGLRDFEQQVDGSKTLADDAISRLPGINGTIQRAAGNNARTQSVLANVSADHSEALAAINALKDQLSGLKEGVGNLPDHSGLEGGAATLNTEAKDLKTEAEQTARDLEEDLNEARALKDDAEEAAVGAAAASDGAKRGREAVARTLQDINKLLADMEHSAVDEDQLKQLEDSLSRVQEEVHGRLTSRLQDMWEQEGAQRRHLSRISLDLDRLLVDVTNLEDILNAVPSGCYNTDPIEEA